MLYCALLYIFRLKAVRVYLSVKVRMVQGPRNL